MEKINFENKPSTNTPINATNLNLLQDNIEDEFDIKDAEIGDLNSLNTTDKSNLVIAINEINLQNKGVILWTNSNPNISFEPQEIQLDLSLYDYCEIWAKNYVTENYISVWKFRFGQNVRIQDSFASNGVAVRARTITTSQSGVVVSEGRYAVGNATYSVNNDSCIPLYIIGYKTKTFS